jgi:uncharacterized protein YoxC
LALIKSFKGNKMELILAFAFVAIVAYLLINRKPEIQETIDKTVEPVMEEVTKTVAAVKETLDVNKDGQVNLEDVKTVVKRGRKKKVE